MYGYACIYCYIISVCSDIECFFVFHFSFICLSDRLSYQSVIGKRFALNGPTGEIVEELVFVPAPVEAGDEHRGGILHRRSSYVMEDTTNPVRQVRSQADRIGI